jgi:tetratricopeptide (TPR) repeat protein/peroxiredoxin
VSGAGKTRRPFDDHLTGSSRRNFLFRCCQGASMAVIPASLRGLILPCAMPFVPPQALPSDGGFHLHPHYRAQLPLDATLLKTQAGLDAFVSEKYHEQIARILAEWSSSLLQTPQDMRAIEQVLSSDFSGSSLQPVESRSVRHDPALAVQQNKFDPHTTLGRDSFSKQLRSALSVFSKLVNAEFHVTNIVLGAASTLQLQARLLTRVRYELVGTGAGFYREQRVGSWEIEWISSTPGEFQIRSWRAIDETRSSATSPVFSDITSPVLGGNASYAAQILRGVDYWRTVLDGACGIDIYGHNGVSMADIDDDGFDDLYICQPAGLPNLLYRNRGDGTFEDVTERSGLGLLDNTACALFADFNNDGHQDVVVVRANGPLLFLNEGGGKFRQKPGAFQFANPPQGTFTGAAVADYDRDGWLDIYFCLYVFYQGTGQYKYPVPYYDAENGPPNFMMRNQGDGTFRDVTAESGLNQNNTRYSFCCSWGDYNSDGWPDLYVANDFGSKNLYRNNGNGTFTDVASQAGVEDVGAGMSVCWLDYDNDGAQDLYVGDMWSAAGERISSQEIFKKDAPKEVRALYQKHARGNSLFRNRGLKTGAAFEDRTDAGGVAVGRWAWSSDTFDFDHDGFPDFYIANGMVSGSSRPDLNGFFWRQVVANSPDTARPSQDYERGWSAINELIRSDGTWSGFERNVFYTNNRDGTFSDVSGAVGLDFIEDGRSFALADFDHDGRQEVFLKNRNAPQLRLLKNVMEPLPASMAFRLRGTKSNRDAIGATVTLENDAGRQTRTLQSGSGFLSQHSKEVFFGLGRSQGPVKVSIRWPSGLVQDLHNLPPNHRVWVEEGSETLRIEQYKERESLRAAQAPAPQRKSESLPVGVETWLLAPIAAPDLSLPDLDGQVRSLGASRGKPVLLNFWTAQSANYQEPLRMFSRAFSHWKSLGLQLLAVNLDDPANPESLRAMMRQDQLAFPILLGSDDVAGIYNLLYRYLFDRHRDLGLPTSFLINDKGEIVKLYQGPVIPEQVEKDCRSIPGTNAERLARALPFPGVSETFEFGRNYLSYGSVFFQRGYFDQAASSFQLAVRDDPSSAEALYGLGSAYLNLKKPLEAREGFESATKLRASYPDTLANAWNNLGLLAARENRTDEAVRNFREAVRLSPDHLIALNNLGNAYRQVKQWDEAQKVFEHSLEVNSADPEANYGLAMVFAQSDDTVRASEYLRKALTFRPVYPEALNNLGILYLRTERRNDAVASFQECIRVAPDFDQPYLNLARVYSAEGSPAKARTVLVDLLKQHPDHAQAQNMLAQLPQ